MQDLNDVTTIDLFDLDAQLRDMFSVHRELFDSQERKKKRDHLSPTMRRKYDDMGKHYASGLHRQYSGNADWRN